MLLVYGQFYAINTRDCTYIWLCVLYCSEVGWFRVGVGGGGLSAPMKVNIYINIYIFLQCMQTIKLRQTTEDPSSGPSFNM